jgi:Ni/Fe-hydrogenase subunit HybB-like protein
LYLLLKLVDLGARGDLNLIFTEFPVNLLWWGEIIIGVILPIILLSITKIRESRKGVFWGATLVVAGLIFNRFNVSMFALAMRPGYSYFPHWMEIAVSAALVADAMIVIWLAYRLLPISREEAPSPRNG